MDLLKNKKDFLFLIRDKKKSEALSSACAKLKYSFQSVESFSEAIEILDQERFKVIFVDLDEGELQGLELLQWLKGRQTFTYIVTHSDKTNEIDMTSLLRLGVQEVLQFHAGEKQDDIDNKLLAIMDRYLSHFHRVISKYELNNGEEPVLWVSEDLRVQKLPDIGQEILNLENKVLIEGEYGCGKRLLAKVIAASLSQGKKIAYLDLGQVQQEDVEKFFCKNFKNEKLILIINHIDDLDLDLQKALVDYFFKGSLLIGDKEWNGHLQLIATTNQDLEELMLDGKIDESLFYVLNDNKIIIPPLRKRVLDIALLARYFLEIHAKEKLCYFSEDAIWALQDFSWQGNVKELEAVVKNMVEKNDNVMIKSSQLPGQILEKTFYVRNIEEDSLAELPYNEAKKISLNRFHEKYIADLLDNSGFNYTVAAEKAGMDRSNFKKIIKKYYH